MKLPMTFFDSRRIGEVVSRFTDAGKVREAVIGATVTIMVDTLMAIAGAIVLYLQNAKMFFITLAVVLVYAVIALAYNGLFRRLNEEVMENLWYIRKGEFNMEKNLLIELEEEELETVDGGKYVCLPLYEMYGNGKPYGRP